MPGSLQGPNSVIQTTGGKLPRRWQTLPGWTLALSRKRREAVSCNHIICLWNSEKAARKQPQRAQKKSSHCCREMRTTFNLLLLPKPHFHSPSTAKHSSLVSSCICTHYFYVCCFFLFLLAENVLFPRVNNNLWQIRRQRAHKIFQRLLLFTGWRD